MWKSKEKLTQMNLFYNTETDLKKKELMVTSREGLGVRGRSVGRFRLDMCTLLLNMGNQHDLLYSTELSSMFCTI